MPEAIALTAVAVPAVGDEPCPEALRCLPGDGTELTAGWYMLTGRVDARFPARLQLVQGAGQGRSAIPLVVSASGDLPRLNILRLALPTHSLDLETVVPGAGLPSGVELHLEPIGRLRAMATMLAAHRSLGGWRQWSALAASVVEALYAIATGGGASAARRLHTRYLELVNRLERERTGDPPDAVMLRLRPSWVPTLSQRISMRPAGQLRSELAHGQELWQSTGDDPKFVSSRLERPLAPGWYRLRARIQVVDGHVVGPCLYPDYGQGDSEGALIPLGEPDGEGMIDLLLVLRHPTRALRFDPTMRQARFRLDGMRFERLGRMAALLYMVSRLTGQGGRPAWRERASALRRFLVELPRKGLSGATSELFRRYHDSAIRSQVSYESWVERYDNFTPLDLAKMRERAAAIVHGPCFSILVPVYETPEPWLRRCIESVLAQAYPHWELCLADDASPSPHVRRILAEYAARDPRIKVVHRDRNGHISAASNSALDLATGQYIGLLDHDDELRPHALLEVAEALQRQPDLKVIYSDEDKIDEQGRRFDPYFKPDWNPDLLRSQNYLCHFSVVDAELMRLVGGFRLGFEGSQDHDLLLRCTERAGPGEVHHIPHVLYHWRAIAGSTALVRDAKDYAADAGARAVADHLVRTSADARVEQLPHGHYRVHWGLGPEPPRVSLVIPTRDRVDLLRTCVESLLARTDYPDFEIVIVDNQSRETETFAYFAELEREGRARVLRYDAPFNYSAINNWAVSQCEGALVGLLNNDIEVISPDWLREMAGHALRPEIGAVGAMLYYPDDTIQHAGVVLGIGGVANHAYLGQPRGYPGHGGRAKVAQGLSAVTGACLLVRRESYQRVGGLDESLQVAFNDVDFCLRLRAIGLQNLWTPFAEFYHHESATRGSEDTPEKAARFRGEVERMESRWGEQLYRDPAYNPNLTLFGTHFGYAFPPRVGPASGPLSGLPSNQSPPNRSRL